MQRWPNYHAESSYPCVVRTPSTASGISAEALLICTHVLSRRYYLYLFLDVAYTCSFESSTS